MRSVLTFAATTIALASTISATASGPQCDCTGLNNCLNQGAWGCVQLAGPNCVDQTQSCSITCGGGGFMYAYQKHNSDDRQCVCSNQDASQTPNCPGSSPVLNGGQCNCQGLNNCHNQGAWGCVQLAGPNCVDQTQNCRLACGGSGYMFAYQKHGSPDRRCVCSNQDAAHGVC
ncbi:hypothetical protein AC579_6553 [Pseudocercospora musae]|uniref:Uncharacterized protein n=1 Tax=Pseudocercospora musae TaxID=113226 RepID=A0A139I4X0_9PEZI|nr:hypothetical protein AC579_6553 [Pseudocercospora musae]